MGLFENFIQDVIVKITESQPTVEKVIFNKPATIVFWSDGTKTVAKCNECPGNRRGIDGDHWCKDWAACMFNKHTGFAVACARKVVPNLSEKMRELDEQSDR